MEIKKTIFDLFIEREAEFSQLNFTSCQLI